MIRSYRRLHHYCQVKLTVELPAGLHRDLMLYGELRIGEHGPVPPQKLVVPRLERFLASDRGFAKARRSVRAGHRAGASPRLP
ncbi:DUF2274 domain-containing protein [Paracoccus pantotrophus]|nr:DUF2274 domain-containing protein [Paracoccus pantotrophus]QFG34818.1 DUF2274 domain-containing protein [Paracoccus pantotrophus]